MSSGTRNPSLLVISNRVYVKGDDGVFYSGSIEGKLEDNSYVVRFDDDKKRLVCREQDLIWLGFCDLPTSWWPENPVVRPTILSDDTFEGTVRFVGNTAKAPASFTVRSNEDVKCSSLGGDLPGEKLLLGDRVEPRTQGLYFPEEQGGVKQARFVCVLDIYSFCNTLHCMSLNCSVFCYVIYLSEGRQGFDSHQCFCRTFFLIYRRSYK